ncbi:MAG TPA: phosphotransferase family protein [Acidimicrobiales bacterium]|jgi:aminoglycoside phosphotransferase (APT) family kinase protein
MALTIQRDDSALAAGFTRWLTRHRDLIDVSVVGLGRPSAGYASETVIVQMAWSGDGGRPSGSFVIRMAPSGEGTFPHYDLLAQWQAQMAAAGAGVPVADPVLEPDPGWLGAPFLVMPRVDGHIVGAVARHDRWLGRQTGPDRELVYRNFITSLSAIHRADADAAPEVPRRDNASELDYWDEYLRWSSEGTPVPVLVGALEWCRRNRPATEPEPALLWGDPRLENVVFGDDLAPLAVLDWDMTSVGPPEHDLAWFTSHEMTMDHLFGEAAGGAPTRGATVMLFEQCEGRPVRDLDWYETLAMVRSAAVMTRIGYLRRRAGEPPILPIDDNPILDLVKSRIA